MGKCGWSLHGVFDCRLNFGLVRNSVGQGKLKRKLRSAKAKFWNDPAVVACSWNDPADWEILCPSPVCRTLVLCSIENLRTWWNNSKTGVLGWSVSTLHTQPEQVTNLGHVGTSAARLNLTWNTPLTSSSCWGWVLDEGIGEWGPRVQGGNHGNPAQPTTKAPVTLIISGELP